MRWLLPLGILMPVLFFGSFFAIAAPTDRAELEALIDGVIERQLEEKGLVGAAVSVVAGGEVMLSKGYGYANVAARIPVDGEKTLFRVGSISKLFVWTAVMQLVEQGKLDLETDVNMYLDFSLPGEIMGGKGEAPPITLAHLMAHTPGFEDVGQGLFQLSEDQMLPLSEYVRTNIPARVFPPGELVAYSNYGTALAAYIVELVSGQQFADYVEEHILKPLGMERSTFRQPIPKHLAHDAAFGHRYIDGEAVAADFLFVLEAPGALSSTASDMARFMLAHLHGGELDGKRMMQEETVRQMQTRLFSQHPLLDGSAHGFFEYTVNGRRALFHPGAVILFNSALFLLPDEGVGLFVSYNGDSYTAPKELFQAFMDHYYPEVPEAVETISLTPTEGAGERAQKFTGEYHINRRSFTDIDAILSLLDTMHIDVDSDGYLIVQHMGETTRFVEMGPGVYRNTESKSVFDPYGAFRTLVFQSGPAGQTVLLTDGPMSYSKAPWYATRQFTIGTLVATISLLISAPIFWFVARRMRMQALRRPQWQRLARTTAAVFGLLTVFFLGGLLAATGEMEPVYQLPMAYFGVEPAWTSALDLLPPLLLAVWVGMVGFTIAAWWKSDWRIPSRLHYTLLTASAACLLATLRYWNLI